jgi:ABC-type transporter Mla subunit MlaD
VNLGRVAVLLLLLAAGGCGGDDTSSAERWAGDVCTEVNEWADEVDAALETFADGGLALDEQEVRAAVDRVADATDELRTDLNALGPPETESGREAQEELEGLADDLREQLEAVEDALRRADEPLEAVAAIAGTLEATAKQLQERLDTLERLDPAGELADGFRNSDECKDLRERIREAGS